MLHQYNAQRFRTDSRGRRVGTIAVGSIVYLQDGAGPFGFRRHAPVVCRNPWQVVAWLNREYCHCHGRVTMMAGGHLAIVRSLRDGLTATVADWLLRLHDDAGLLS